MRLGRITMSIALLAGTAIAVQAQTIYRFESVVSRELGASQADGLFYPSGVALDPAGTLWVADTANHVIRIARPDGTLEIVAGTLGVDGARDGDRLHSTFSYPQGLAFDAAGNLFIADSGNGTIRRLRTDGVVETWAGSPDERGTADGHRTEARFITPVGLAWDFTGELWVTDYSAHTVRRIENDGEVTTVSGRAEAPGYADGDGDWARLNYPAGIDIDAQGRLWIADTGNGLIRFVSRDGYTGTIAGQPGNNLHRDGSLSEAGFDHPADVVINQDGVAFVADSWSHTIRMITEEGVSTIAGLPGQPGYLDGSGPAARFDHPLALVLDRNGTLIVADMLNHVLRRGTEDGFGQVRRRTIGR